MKEAPGRSAIDDALAQPSLPAAFLAQAAASPQRVALRAFGSPEQLTLGEWSARARAVAGGLASLGVGPGERVGLLLRTCMEFHIADMGALLAGAIPFSLYVTSPVSQLREIVENAGPRVLITEEALAGKARELAAVCPVIENLVVVEPHAATAGELSLAALEARCPAGFDVGPAVAAARREDICTLVYTSGTTGPPKGVQFRHGGMLDCLDSIRQRFETTSRDRAVSYLPMAHVAERIFGHYAAFVYGYEVTSLADLSQLGAALREVRPTRFFGVPRIYEKLLAGLQQAIAASPQRDRLQSALAARLSRVRAEQAGQVPAGDDGDDKANRDLLRPLAALTGLEQAHFLAVAGAPSSLGMLEELTAFGLPINEFYGSSETIIVTCSPPGEIRLGTAGTPLARVRLRLGEDGEVLIAGPTITPGYFRDPERTRDALGPDGWFHTGDIGHLDADGFLSITDRKKDILVTAGGKNIAPQNIEGQLKAACPYVSQVVMLGDRRPFCVALITLNEETAGKWAREHGIEYKSYADLAARPAIQHLIRDGLEAVNATLASYERIKDFHLLDHDLSQETGELTPKMSVKRKVVEANHKEILEGFYKETVARI
jgi:long-chain acyl-CoA synthetase